MSAKITKKAIKKRRGLSTWRRMFSRWFIIMILIFTISTGWWLVSSPLSLYLYNAGLSLGKSAGLIIKNIDIYGHYNTSEQQIMDQLDVSAGDLMFGFSPRTAMQRLQGLPWIDSVEIRRVFPNHIYVFIQEKKPAAIWTTAKNELVMVDSKGSIIAPKNTDSQDYLLHIQGANAPENLKSLLSLLEHRHYLMQNVSYAEFVGQRRWDLILNNRTRILLPQKNMETALNQLDTYLQNDNLIERGAEKIDLRLPQKIIIKP